LKNRHLHCQLRAIANKYILKRVTSLSASFYILNLCVLLVLGEILFLYCLEETFCKLIDLPLSNSPNRRIHTWWLDCYDVLNGFVMK